MCFKAIDLVNEENQHCRETSFCKTCLTLVRSNFVTATIKVDFINLPFKQTTLTKFKIIWRSKEKKSLNLKQFRNRHGQAFIY